MTEATTLPEPDSGGVIHDVAMLDLTASTRPEDLAHIRRIEDVAVILVRESAAPALTRINLSDVASVVQVPEHGVPRVHTGTLVMTGAAFADESVKNDVLVVTGTLIVTEPVQKVVLAGLIVTGSVLAPEGSEALAAALTRLTGAFTTFPYREGQHIDHRSGNVELGPAGLANREGTPDDILLVSGALTVRGDVSEVGYARIIVAGTLIAPRSLQDLLEPRLTASSSVWYAAPPKVFSGTTALGRTFFQLLEEPVTLILSGATTIDADVTLDDVKPAVAAVYSHGALKAPKDVLGLFQVREGRLSGTVSAWDA
ncbi:MAG: hypothetical protein J2P43_07780 [Candidatus Dormibacteraeota bacterium]|nr:hypothetical protein [Candidatus Dormibacteraeota bacterium]